MNFYDLDSNLRRHLKRNKLNINRRYVDRRDSRKNYATLQQQRVQKIIHDERYLSVMSCENDVAKMKIYRIAWFIQSAASFASHVEYFFAEIENYFMRLFIAS
jgi:hypothetical protein